jgi:hypothetical protein
MPGFVLDFYLGYLVRWLILLWRKSASANWPTVAGSIDRCNFDTQTFGGDYVGVQYRYEMDSERFQGVLKKPYIYPNYAAAFARFHPADRELKIRVSPQNPAQSFPVLD